MELYINDIGGINPDKNKFAEELNNGDYVIHETLDSAKIEAKIMAGLAWAIYDKPVDTYKITCSEEGVISNIEKVGYQIVEEDSEGMSKQEILDAYNISEGDINDILGV